MGSVQLQASLKANSDGTQAFPELPGKWGGCSPEEHFGFHLSGATWWQGPVAGAQAPPCSEGLSTALDRVSPTSQVGSCKPHPNQKQGFEVPVCCFPFSLPFEYQLTFQMKLGFQP